MNGTIDDSVAPPGRLSSSPSRRRTSVRLGQDATTFFFPEIAHYLYAGDTALHMAAAGFRRPVAELLVAHGADCRARNRRGAEPLHYAADANRWNPTAQADTIRYLLSIGAVAGRGSTNRAWRRCTGRCGLRSLAAVQRLPGRRGYESAEAEPGRVDAAAPRRPDHGPRRQRFAGGSPAAGGHRAIAGGARRQTDRQGWTRANGRAGGDECRETGACWMKWPDEDRGERLGLKASRTP